MSKPIENSFISSSQSHTGYKITSLGKKIYEVKHLEENIRKISVWYQGKKGFL